MNGCAVLNGIAGTVPCAGPPLVASTWFPPRQRATATATASVFNYAGVAVAFVIGICNIKISCDNIHSINKLF